MLWLTTVEGALVSVSRTPSLSLCVSLSVFVSVSVSVSVSVLRSGSGSGFTGDLRQDFQDDDREAWRARSPSDCGDRATLSKHGMENAV